MVFRSGMMWIEAGTQSCSAKFLAVSFHVNFKRHVAGTWCARRERGHFCDVWERSTLLLQRNMYSHTPMSPTILFCESTKHGAYHCFTHWRLWSCLHFHCSLIYHFVCSLHKFCQSWESCSSLSVCLSVCLNLGIQILVHQQKMTSNLPWVHLTSFAINEIKQLNTWVRPLSCKMKIAFGSRAAVWTSQELPPTRRKNWTNNCSCLLPGFVRILNNNIPTWHALSCTFCDSIRSWTRRMWRKQTSCFCPVLCLKMQYGEQFAFFLMWKTHENGHFRLARHKISRETTHIQPKTTDEYVYHVCT